MRKTLKIAGLLLLGLVVLIAVVPFLVPVRPLDGLAPVRAQAGPDDSFVTLPFEGTDGIDIRYIEAGDPEAPRTLLLLHGSLFNAATWDEVIAPLAQAARVIAYDQAPYGLSEKTLPGEWSGASPLTVQAAVARIPQLMDALGVERATLVANSFGATLAVMAATAYPERIEALVLGNAAVFVNEDLPAWLMTLPQVNRIGPLLARGIGTSDAFLDTTWAKPETMSEERRAKTLIHAKAENWDRSLWAYLQTWRTPALDAEIAALSLPTLVLTGAADGVIPVSDSERLAAMIPGAALAVIPDCGHVPQEECPRAYLEAITPWLAALD